MNVNELRLNKLERENAQVERLGINVSYIVNSVACSVHKTRHGELHSFSDVERLYSPAQIESDCKCSLLQIPLDSSGVPLSQALVDSLRDLAR